MARPTTVSECPSPYPVCEKSSDLLRREAGFQKDDVVVPNVIHKKQLLGEEPRVKLATELLLRNGEPERYLPIRLSLFCWLILYQ
jgi:hypothetical protein